MAMDLSDWKFEDLRKECRTRGLSAIGSEDDLIRRLETYYSKFSSDSKKRCTEKRNSSYIEYRENGCINGTALQTVENNSGNGRVVKFLPSMLKFAKKINKKEIKKRHFNDETDRGAQNVATRRPSSNQEIEEEIEEVAEGIIESPILPNLNRGIKLILKWVAIIFIFALFLSVSENGIYQFSRSLSSFNSASGNPTANLASFFFDIFQEFPFKIFNLKMDGNSKRVREAEKRVRAISIELLGNWSKKNGLSEKWLDVIEDLHFYVNEDKIKAPGVLIDCRDPTVCKEFSNWLEKNLNEKLPNGENCVGRLKGGEMHGLEIAGETQREFVKVLRLCTRALFLIEDAHKIPYGAAKVFVNALSEGGHFQDRGEEISANKALYILIMESKSNVDINMEVEKYMAALKWELVNSLPKNGEREITTALALKRRIDFVIPMGNWRKSSEEIIQK